ncbi:MAG: hypothetical protein GX616_17730, partial [Planctomycetes bacterium]|nr:hypothetical protein [Planctomycetota bacterium]
MSWFTMPLVLAVFAISVPASAWAAEARALSGDDMEIRDNTLIKPGHYRLPDAGDDGAIRITGNDITVDFQGAELDGSSEGQQPDAFTGRGIVIRG